MERAQQYFDAGKYREAEIELRNALQIDPKLAVAHMKLGKTYLAMHDYRGAFVELRRAIELADGLRDAHLEIGRLYLTVGETDKAEAEAHLLTARNPRDADAYLLLASANLVGHHVEDADAAVKQALAIEPNSATAHLTLGRVLVTQGNATGGEAEIERAIKLAPNAVDGPLTLAAFYRIRGDYPRAEAAYKQAASVAPTDVEPRFLLGDLYIEEKKYDDALGLFERVAQDGPDRMAAKKRLVDLYFDLNKIPEAERGVQELRAADKGDLETRYLDARLLLVKGKTDPATQELEGVLKDWPGFTRARYQLALAHLGSGKADQAIGDLTECLRREPQFVQARYLLAELQFKARAFDLAKEEAQKVLQAVPKDYGMELLLSNAALAERDFKTARGAAEQLIRDFPTSAGGYQQLGRVLGDTGQLSEAQAQLEHALAVEPGAAPAASALADLVTVMRAQKRPESECISRVRNYGNAHPDNGPVQLLLGQLLIEDHQTDAGTQVLETAVQKYPNLLAAYYLLGATYGKEGMLEQARARFEALLKHQARVAPVYMMLGVIDDLQGRAGDGAEQYKRALDIDPNFAPAANNLAWYYAEQGDQLDLALELAQRAKSLLPDEPHVADTLGWVLYRRGLYAAAIEPLKQSAEKLANDPQVRYHLGMAYLRNGQTQQAREELNAALKLGQFPQADDVKHTLAGLS